jgi:AcrR family transcriptional regulator
MYGKEIFKMEEGQTKTNRKIRYTKMVLRESLMELMKSKAISDISIKEICAGADISRSTFYAHYKDQYDLLQKIEEETLTAANSILNKHDYIGNKHGALKMVEEMLQYIADNNKSIHVLLSENGDINFQKRLFSSMYQRNVMKIMTDKLPDEETREYYFMFIVNGSIGLIYHWIKSGLNKTVSELAKLIINITKQIGP